MSIPAVVYAPGALGTNPGKTANDLVIYNGRKFNVVAVVDPTKAGMDAGEVVGVGKRGIPVVASLEEAYAYNPKAFIIGVAPVGGMIPEDWYRDIEDAIKHGLDIYSGMHIFLSEDPRISKLAKEYGVKIHDVRKPRRELLRIWDGRVLKTKMLRILIAGTDCVVGKNLATMEVAAELERRGIKTCIIGTGQTMLLLGAKGAVIDAIPADFGPGVVENFVYEAYEEGYEAVVVEGQGALLHPAYGQVTLAILHGCAPTHIVLCHHPGRTRRSEFEQVPLPDPSLEASLLLDLNPYRESRIAGLCINTSRMSREEAEKWKALLYEKFEVPVADPLRDGVGEIVDNILATAEGTRSRS